MEMKMQAIEFVLYSMKNGDRLSQKEIELAHGYAVELVKELKEIK